MSTLSAVDLAPRSVASGSLSDLVDGVACRTGAWVVVEQFGTVVTHGAGRSPCLPELTTALLQKSTRPLRAAVSWTGGGRRLTGTLSGAALTAVDLGDGGTVWFIDGDVADDALPLLAAALGDGGGPPCDPMVESLLHPRGPSRGTPAPPAVLVAFTSASPLRVLARAVVSGTTSASVRIHTDRECVIVAVATRDEAREISAAVRERCVDTWAGCAPVAPDAGDWVIAARHAQACSYAAQRLGLPLAVATSPVVVAELIVSHVHEAASALARQLPRTPLSRLQDYDTRMPSDLVATMRAWCAAGFDVTAASSTLHVHANTLRYRIRRAGEISGLDLSDPRQLLALQVLLTA